MNNCTYPIDVAVVFKQNGAIQVLSNIRRWCHTVSQPAYRSAVDFVSKEGSLANAFGRYQKSVSSNILISIGFSDSELGTYLQQHRNREEIIIRPPRSVGETERNEMPSASMIEPIKSVVYVQNTIPALKKSILRIKTKRNFTVRLLENEDDFKKCFSLRYQVWRKMGYIPTENDSEQTRMELNYSDLTALSIGCFTKNGKLIGTARLVFPHGTKTAHVSIIKKLVTQLNDPILVRSLEYPQSMSHPFDVLQSFDGFQSFYKNLIRERIEKAEVSRVIVDPEYRNQGLGQVLVDSLKSLAKRYEISLIFLACTESNVTFYNNCGFKLLEGEGMRCDKFVNVEVPAVIMVQDLNNDG